jgi:hypothetical protein
MRCCVYAISIASLLCGLVFLEPIQCCIYALARNGQVDATAIEQKLLFQTFRLIFIFELRDRSPITMTSVPSILFLAHSAGEFQFLFVGFMRPLKLLCYAERQTQICCRAIPLRLEDLHQSTGP